jgi:hypothetical protein
MSGPTHDFNTLFRLQKPFKMAIHRPAFHLPMAETIDSSITTICVTPETDENEVQHED